MKCYVFGWQVVKEWTDVEEVGVEDRLMTGAPQLMLRLRGCTEPLVVDEENGWNAVGVGSVEPEETPLHSVVRALQAQLQNSLQNLHEVQRCTSLRSAALNRLTYLVQSNFSMLSNLCFTHSNLYLFIFSCCFDLFLLRLEFSFLLYLSCRLIAFIQSYSVLLVCSL